MSEPVLAEAPLSLHTLQWGRHNGRRVLLVHGVQAAADVWWQVADGLARAGVHVTAPDLRGHGRSPSAGSYRLADFAADLKGLGGGWELVVGHSLGGTLLAYELANGNDLASRAVLLDPVVDLPEDSFEAVVSGQLAELASADAVAFQAANPSWHPEDCRLKALAAAACSPFVNEAVLRENRPWDYRGLLDAIEIPVLILGGDPQKGAMFDPRLGEELAAKEPNIRYRQLAGAGHSLHRDSPAQVLGALLDTIDDGV